MITKWKCPTCKQWVAEPIGKSCSKCVPRKPEAKEQEAA
jgi:hypothetical protein